MPKLYWHISPAPTGKYRSFAYRGWPTASQDRKGDVSLFNVVCEENYSKRRADSGDHKPLKLRVAVPTGLGRGFEWRGLKGEFKTLAEAKARAQAFYDEHHEKLKRQE